jgi:hypothetical protein
VSTYQELEDALIALLATAATTPGTMSPYVEQEDLKFALGIVSDHTMSDVVTRAALHVGASYPGSAIVRSKILGYRLTDEATTEELAEERTRLRCAKTKLERTGIALSANNNGPLARLVGQQLIGFITAIFDPILENMDQIVGGARAIM